MCETYRALISPHICFRLLSIVNTIRLDSLFFFVLFCFDIPFMCIGWGSARYANFFSTYDQSLKCFLKFPPPTLSLSVYTLFCIQFSSSFQLRACLIYDQNKLQLCTARKTSDSIVCPTQNEAQPREREREPAYEYYEQPHDKCALTTFRFDSIQAEISKSIIIFKGFPTLKSLIYHFQNEIIQQFY